MPLHLPPACSVRAKESLTETMLQPHTYTLFAVTVHCTNTHAQELHTDRPTIHPSAAGIFLLTRRRRRRLAGCVLCVHKISIDFLLPPPIYLLLSMPFSPNIQMLLSLAASFTPATPLCGELQFSAPVAVVAVVSYICLFLLGDEHAHTLSHTHTLHYRKPIRERWCGGSIRGGGHADRN